MYQNFFNWNQYSAEEQEIIGKLLNFNCDQYLRASPDVAQAGMNPLEHFVVFGMYEGRFVWLLSEQGSNQLPFMSPEDDLHSLLGFDRLFYKNLYPDVPADGYAHFINHGIAEGRLPFDLNENSACEQVVWDVFSELGIQFNEKSLDRQAYFKCDGQELTELLVKKLHQKQLTPKTYRNNYWLALAVGYSAKSFFGAASLCYNFFYNYFLPMPYLKNWAKGVYITGKIFQTVNYAVEHDWYVQELIVDANVLVPNPVFLNRSNCSSDPESYMLPPVHYCILENVVLIGGNSAILSASHDILYDYIDISPSVRQAELKGPNILHVVNDACTVKYIYSDLGFTEAFSLMHDHGHNYFHWLIEVLPRLLAAIKNKLIGNIPILIDEKIGRLQEEVIRIILGDRVQIVSVPRNHSVKVDKLHWISDLSINTVHTLDLPQKNDILISSTAISLIREYTRDFFVSDFYEYNKVLILRTNVEFRRLVNRALFQKEMINNGFLGIDPAKLTFVEQIRVFSNASILIMEAGAAQANLVFCKPGTLVLILVNGYKNSNYFYLAQIAEILDIKLVFFECFRLSGSHFLGVHDDMVIHLHSFKKSLASIQ